MGSNFTFFRRQVGSEIFLGPIVFLLILLLNSVRVPMGLVNFWAEDGVVFYSDVINKDFPQRLFTDSGAGGYLNLSGKMIAEFVGLFSIEIAPIINFILVNLSYSILIMIIFKRVNPYFQNKVLLLLFLGFFVFVPIATFDSLATSINLHFFLLFSTFIIIFTNFTRPTATGHVVVFITCLSDPLAILLAPGILAIYFLKKQRNGYMLTYLFSLSIQIASILHFFGSSTRVVGNDPSISKTIYLFMDRVVGVSFIPIWGFVDKQTLETGGASSTLIFRFLIGALVLISILFLALKASSISVKQFRVGQDFLIASMILTLSTYWGIVGILFNPEPRYAIFPSLCLGLVLLLSLDTVISSAQNALSQKLLIICSSILFTSIYASAFHVSEIRETDQNWKKQIEDGRAACDEEAILDFQVNIPPKRNSLVLTINCKDLS